MHQSGNFPRVGVAVIVIREGKVLVGKRLNSHGHDTWNFPGGHLEMNEEIEQCAIREVKEETGLNVEIIGNGPYTNDIFPKEKKHYITLFVIARSAEGTPQVLEANKCEEWKWVKWNELPEPLFLPIKNLLKTDFSIAKWLK